MNGSRSGLDADSNAESIAGVTTYATFSPATGAYLTGTGRNATDSRSRSKSWIGIICSHLRQDLEPYLYLP